MPLQLKTVLSYIQTSFFPSAGKLIKEILFFDVKSIIFLKSFVVHSCEKKKKVGFILCIVILFLMLLNNKNHGKE